MQHLLMRSAARWLCAASCVSHHLGPSSLKSMDPFTSPADSIISSAQPGTHPQQAPDSAVRACPVSAAAHVKTDAASLTSQDLFSETPPIRGLQGIVQQLDALQVGLVGACEGRHVLRPADLVSVGLGSCQMMPGIGDDLIAVSVLSWHAALSEASATCPATGAELHECEGVMWHEALCS